MDRNTFTIQGTWRALPEGQEYEAVAKTNDKAKRFLARATAHVSLDTGDALDRAFGSEGRRAIEASTNNTCEQLALGFPG
jgi:hypothetical protein